MRRVFKVLAIVVLLLTVIGAGVVLYALNTFMPQVVQVSVIRTSAEQAQDTFDDVLSQIDEQAFVGRQFVDVNGLRAEDCAFETYTVRLRNIGFFPAEWIVLDVQPAQGDVLQLGDMGAYVLTAGSTGDLSATVLTTLGEGEGERTLQVTCYVFGRKLVFGVDVP